MAENLTDYLIQMGVKVRYMHHDIDTIERMEIIRDLRLGEFDVLCGINLLREGLDIPEVSLVAILDADKEGFLRSETSLIQTIGRAARNVDGRVIMYADKVSKAMDVAIKETERRRAIQDAYNKANGITPTQIKKNISNALAQERSEATELTTYKDSDTTVAIACDPIVEYMSCEQLEKSIARTRRFMEEAASKMEFIEAAQYRDEMFKLQELLKDKQAKVQ
jgi:excinuclease ABC subunit B